MTNVAEKDVNIGADGFYIINCPKYIYPNTVYSVVVNILNATQTCKITLTLAGPDELPQQVHTIQIEPMTTQTVDFQVSDVAQGKYKLTAAGVEGLIFNKSAELTVGSVETLVFLQTDKATYKPADLVQFRVLFLNEFFRPADTRDKPIVIYINDPERNRIKQYETRSLSHGVFSGKLQLSEYPILGNWTISVQYDGKEMATKTFSIDKYVLPSFEVSIDAPQKVSKSDQQFGITVHAKYTFGQPVAGRATITINHVRNLGWQGDNENDEEMKAVEKCVPLNGKAFVNFDVANFLLASNRIPHGSIPLDIRVEMLEELTGNTRSAKASIKLVRNRFNINAPYISKELEKHSDGAELYPYTITVTDLRDEPVCDATNPVRVTQELDNQIILGPIEAFLDKLGTATVQMRICQTDEYTNIRVEYRNEIATSTFRVYNRIKRIKQQSAGLYVETETPILGKNVELEFQAEEPIPYFVYCVIGRSNKLLKSGLVNITDAGAKSQNFCIEPTFEMIPSAKVYVHYIKGNNLEFHETRFSIEKEFLNKISIEAPEQAEPGDDIALNIKTDPNSFVGLMAVDQSVLLLKAGNDLDANGIWTGLQRLPGQQHRLYRHHAACTDIATLTNAVHVKWDENDFIPEGVGIQNRQFMRAAPAMNAMAFGAAPEMHMKQKRCLKKYSMEKPRVRKEFLESWFYDDLIMKGDSFVLKKTIPDTITSWVITGFAVSPRTGFALTDAPTKIKTFRPFFIATDLPYSIKRGEAVSIPIIIFNYTDAPLSTEVLFERNDNQFEFTEQSDENAKSITVGPNCGETLTFAIRPKRIGHVTLRVTAATQVYSDAIQKELKVEPEGVTVYKNHDIFLDASSAESQLQNAFVLDIPKGSVPDSEHIEVSVMADILGSTITNLDKLVRMPCGCGEQNMINFVPNILVLEYLESTQRLTKAVEEKAKRHLEIGYQRELTYKHDDGSYSAFGKSDEAGSTWLTAYVIRSFIRAAKYIEIDQHILEESVRFLLSKQHDDGSFREDGRLFDFTKLKKYGLTAFVLLALLESVHSNNLVQVDTINLDKVVAYLKQNFDACEDSHALSMAAYAVNMRKPETLILKDLQACAQIEGGHKWWTQLKIPTAAVKDSVAKSTKCSEVEITSYMLMALMDRSQSSEVLPIVKWLISKRNSNGGFSSTQDTVVGLQALIKFAKKIQSGVGDFEINITSPDMDGSLGKLQINRDNSLIVQSLEIPRHIRTIKYDVQGNGSGSGIFQLAYRYNMQEVSEGPCFELSASSVQETEGTVRVSVSAKYLLSKCSNMVVTEVSLPSGFKAMLDHFDKIEAVDGVRRVETQNDDTKVIVYLDSFTQDLERQVEIFARRTHIVTEQKPSPVKIYDYYDSRKQATSFYNITS